MHPMDRRLMIDDDSRIFMMDLDIQHKTYLRSGINTLHYVATDQSLLSLIATPCSQLVMSCGT